MNRKLTQKFELQTVQGIEIFIGREPRSIGSEQKEQLKKTGFVEDYGESGMIRYSAGVWFQMKDGTQYKVDSDGYFDIDFNTLDDDEKNTITSLTEEVV